MSLLIMLLLVLLLDQAGAQSIPDRWPILEPCFEHEDAKSCTDSFLQDHFTRHVQLPDTSQCKRCFGTVYIQFTIDSLGMLTQASILRDEGMLGEEVLRVLHLLPKWVPGERMGKLSAVILHLPVVIQDPNPQMDYQLEWGEVVGNSLSKEQLRSLKNEPITIGSEAGDNFSPTGIQLIYRKNGRVRLVNSPPNLSSEAKNLLSHCKPGGELEIIAKFPKGTKFEERNRLWSITKANKGGTK